MDQCGRGQRAQVTYLPFGVLLWSGGGPHRSCGPQLLLFLALLPSVRPRWALEGLLPGKPAGSKGMRSPGERAEKLSSVSSLF